MLNMNCMICAISLKSFFVCAHITNELILSTYDFDNIYARVFIVG